MSFFFKGGGDVCVVSRECLFLGGFFPSPPVGVVGMDTDGGGPREIKAQHVRELGRGVALEVVAGVDGVPPVVRLGGKGFFWLV